MNTLTEYHEAVCQLDPELSETDEAFKVAVVLLAGQGVQAVTDMQHRHCMGCRAVLDMPPQAEDRWGLMQPPPPGFTTETVECSRCGVLDVFLVKAPAEKEREGVKGPDKKGVTP